jgi:hypothetical protein
VTVYQRVVRNRVSIGAVALKKLDDLTLIGRRHKRAMKGVDVSPKPSDQRKVGSFQDNNECSSRIRDHHVILEKSEHVMNVTTCLEVASHVGTSPQPISRLALDNLGDKPLFLVRMEPTRDTYHQSINRFFFGVGIRAIFSGQHLEKPRIRPQKGRFDRRFNIQMIRRSEHLDQWASLQMTTNAEWSVTAAAASAVVARSCCIT